MANRLGKTAWLDISASRPPFAIVADREKGVRSLFSERYSRLKRPFPEKGS
jgi:hypothetical protein